MRLANPGYTAAARRGPSDKLSSRRLPAGDVLFEEIRVLQSGELDGEALFEVAHHAARHLAQA